MHRYADLEKTHPSISRRAAMRGVVSTAAIATIGALAAACGGNTTPTATRGPIIVPTGSSALTLPPPTVSVPTPRPSTAALAMSGMATPSTPTVATTATDGYLPSPVPGVPDAYTKLPPPFGAIKSVPGRGGKVTAFFIAFGQPIPPREQNKYWQELEKRLGITLVASFVPSGSYQEKIAAVTAGGDVSDLTQVLFTNAPDQSKAVLQGAYADLTPYLTGDALNEFPYLAAYPPQLWKNIAIRGKIYGVPRPRYLVNNPLTFRQDWAEKVGIPAAKNADDVQRLFTAFTKNDPDGNGSADTFGLGSDTPGTFSISWFLNMFRVPNVWRHNADGSLTRDIETDEFRAAIAYMRGLWTAGAFHPDTPTLNLQKVQDLFAASRVGGYTAGINGIRGQNNAWAKTRAFSAPNADVTGFIAPGFDGGKAVWRIEDGFLGFVAISAKAGRVKERVRELLRILNYYSAPFGSEEYNFLNYGLEGIHHTLKADGSRILTDQGRTETFDIRQLTTAPPVFYYPDRPEDGPYMQSLVRDMLVLGTENPVQTTFSITSAQKTNELTQLQNDRITAVITGRDPLTALDTFIKDWRSRGGDQIRKEYQDALIG